VTAECHRGGGASPLPPCTGGSSRGALERRERAGVLERGRSASRGGAGAVSVEAAVAGRVGEAWAASAGVGVMSGT
jgi:hypothetical protein